MTPLNVEAYQHLLIETDFHEAKTVMLVNGFKNGFDIEYRGPRDVKIESNNMRLRVGSKFHLWNMIMDEVKEKRYAGPFKECPFNHFIQSPLGKTSKL